MGVEYSIGDQTETLRVAREVVVCGGAVNSPQVGSLIPYSGLNVIVILWLVLMIIMIEVVYFIRETPRQTSLRFGD